MSKSGEPDFKNEINEISKTIDMILKKIESEREKLFFTDSDPKGMLSQNGKIPPIDSGAKEADIPTSAKDKATNKDSNQI
jgi:hypothetical protein